jgi:hypothetical protein
MIPRTIQMGINRKGHSTVYSSTQEPCQRNINLVARAESMTGVKALFSRFSYYHPYRGRHHQKDGFNKNGSNKVSQLSSERRNMPMQGFPKKKRKSERHNGHCT